MERTDAQLVEAACMGDLTSFRELYERHYRMAVGIARSRVSDLHLAEDAAQEAFALACRRLARLRNGERFPQWLGTICRRVAGKMSRSRVQHVPLEDTKVVVANGPQDETHQRVRLAIDKLAGPAREVVLLHYFSGLSYEEIAKSLGISTQSVHGRLQRARRQLASQLSTETSEAIPHER